MFFEAPPTLAKIREMRTITENFFQDSCRFTYLDALTTMYYEEHSTEVEACFDAFKRINHGQSHELIKAELNALLMTETYHKLPLYELLFSSRRRDIFDFAVSPSEQNTQSCGMK